MAFSGGRDSSVLLHALAEARAERLIGRLSAIHVHHGLQAEADAWARRCEQVCADLGVSLRVERVQIDPDHRAGPEAAAREARYTVLRRLLGSDEILATAHHRDDQAETFLIRALRGSGTQGLAGMRAWQRFAAGWLWRPFLHLPGETLACEAKRRRLSFVEDPHNEDPAFLRSFLRHSVLPTLASRLPGMSGNLARCAELSAEASLLLDDLARLDLAHLAQGRGLSISGLAAQTPERARNAVRGWLRSQGLSPPPSSVLARLHPELIEAAADREPKLAWPGGELRRYRDGLYAGPPLPPAPGPLELPWSVAAPAPTLPPGCGTLRVGSTSITTPDSGWSLHFGVTGERLRLAAGGHRQSLKNLFQAAGVPPWVRVRTPFLYHDGCLRWVGGLGWEAGEAVFPLDWEPGCWPGSPWPGEFSSAAGHPGNHDT